MPELSDLFSDANELRVGGVVLSEPRIAEVILSFVPQSIGPYPFTDATELEIMTRAYDTLYGASAVPLPSNTREDPYAMYHPELTVPFFRFCLDHHILHRLESSGYVRSAGYSGAAVGWAHRLWEKSAP